MSNWTPPSPRPREPLPPREGYAEPHAYPPPEQSSRTGLVVSLVIGVVIALLIVVGVAGLMIGRANRTTHVILTPPTAGGLSRNATQESAMADRLARAERDFRDGAFGRVDGFASAIYEKTASGPGSPSGPIAFLGASVKPRGGPSDFVDGFRRSATARGYRVTEVDAGPKATGVCAQSRTSVVITICAWVTEDSMGELIPAVQGWDTEHLADLMRKIRPDVERQKG